MLDPNQPILLVLQNDDDLEQIVGKVELRILRTGRDSISGVDWVMAGNAVGKDVARARQAAIGAKISYISQRRSDSRARSEEARTIVERLLDYFICRGRRHLSPVNCPV